MKMTILRELWIWMKDAVWFLRISRPGVRVPSIAPNHENPNLFSIGEGFGFFVFFGKQDEGSFPMAVCPKPYQKNRITKVTTVKVP
jgi:hypothetical protein